MSPKKEITLLIIICICAFATEFTSNTSMSSIFIPIVDSIAVELKISPIYLLLPLILSVSLAFMLPVATPNNAIIFASGTVRIRDMITTGIVMNILGLSIVYLAANTWLKLVFDVNFVPESIETSSIVNSSFLE
ncbi:solute carrier family 13 member 5 isoform X3 [Brachionus plicatilis]|uniref:Solute carrier family 13 member 5 isoform X3 n=1 Tax=Brachionus plicatilis TaxID=10195 RepID=A0A3M7S4J2_BRAPC|nr:solute carrier family 13 member 5 isoform X3 [Brachionus plicatilis]